MRKPLEGTPLRDVVVIGVLFVILAVQTFLVSLSLDAVETTERNLATLQTFSERSIEVDLAGHRATTQNLRCLSRWILDPERDIDPGGSLVTLENCLQPTPPPPPDPKGS